MCVYLCVVCIPVYWSACSCVCVLACMCERVLEDVGPRLLLLPLFPLRISCIIYRPLMNMVISQRAGRGERASPVLFLHSSDEKGKERGVQKRERAGDGWRNWESVCCWKRNK